VSWPVSWDEHITLIAQIVSAYHDKLQVVRNTGSTGEALHATEQGFAVGMHTTLQVRSTSSSSGTLCVLCC
jgi:4-hydroxy-tetrahydrodipicolinate synthase